ncbi:hypothetical protein ZWY2020_044726 [Hordeum vulgare]|nr:hypothetical protein ZWY2020_044726 [Hordeum vulgare]
MADGDCDCSAFFRVLVLVLDHDTRGYTICAFSSTEPSWSAPIECFSSAGLGVVDAVVHRALARQRRLEQLVHPPRAQALSVLRLCKDCLWLEVWTRRDDERSVTAEWLLTKAMELKRPKKDEDDKKVQSLCLDERSGALYVEDDLERMYTVNLETGVMDEVTDQFWRLKSQTAVPFQMD